MGRRSLGRNSRKSVHANICVNDGTLMTFTPHKKSESSTAVIADLAVVIAATVICGYLAIHFQWTERLFAWTRRLESLQLDELTFVLLSLALGLAWFAARRWRGARRALAARVAIEARLARTLDEQRRLARQFVEQQEHERKRLARELHDELGQFVNAIKLDAVSIRATSADAAAAGASEVCARARSIVASADLVHESVARLIGELRPVGLDELGLSAAIEHCADQWRARLEPASLSLSIDEHVDALDEACTLALYRTVQEALANCARHARATRVEVRVEWNEGTGAEPRGALVRVADDGVGADLGAAPGGLGLVGMRERVTALGGSLSLESAPRAGFRLLARVPAGPAEEARA
jgi:two-component system, NarL family, sensor histidine kinase UhpB